MINIENIKDYVFGAVRIWEEDGYFCFSRFTEKQDEVLITRKNYAQTLATAGMRIEFMTYGGNLSFSFAGIEKKSDDGYFSFDILENGTPVYHYYEDDSPETGEAEYFIPEGKEAKHIAIYLSNLWAVKIKDLKLPEGSVPVKKTYNLLALGDSITQGDFGKHPNHTYINILADNINANLLNQGVEGERFYADCVDENLEFSPDIITIAYGVNDFGAETLRSTDIDEFLKKIDYLYKDKKIFILLPIWCKIGEENIGGINMQGAREYIISVVNKYPYMNIIDCQDFVPHLPDFYGDTKLLHPSDLGHIYYGQRLTDAMKKYL